MENYLVSARKYRPSTFDTVVGQKALTATLRNAIASGRLAHAYLFCGSRGVGKTSCARIFAKTINCLHPTADGNPCNECDSCRAFNEGRSLNIVELDAASNNSVDDIRNLCDQVQIPPTNGRYRVFIVDEVHMLSVAAFNSFLKTLEEPPSYVIFILATTEKHKILPTILSRCQIYDFNRIKISDMIDHLEFVARSEGMNADRSALSVIASKADGAMRDALSIFDQVAASSRGNITYQSTIDNLNVLDTNYYSRLFDAFLKEDVPAALSIYKTIRDKGFDSHFFVNGLARYLRDLMVAQNDSTLPLLDTDETVKKTMQQQARKCEPQFFYAAMSLCNDADLNYRLASDKTFLVELLLIKLCQQQSPFRDSDGNREGQLRPVAATTSAKPEARPQQEVSVAEDPVPAYQASTPRPPQPQQPKPAVHAPAAAPAPPAPKSGRRSPLRRGPSLSDLNREINSTGSEDNATGVFRKPARTASYTDSDVTRAWEAFMQARPSEHILVNTMRASMPSRVEGDLFRIVVENHGQLEKMTDALTDLYPHMRDALSNDNWTLTIEENRGEGSPMTWNDREVLRHIYETNEVARNFINDFKLSL